MARVDIKGETYTIGTEGKKSVVGQGGVVITFHSTGLTESHPDTGLVAKFLCSRYSLIVSVMYTYFNVHVHNVFALILYVNAMYTVAWGNIHVHVQLVYVKYLIEEYKCM